MTENLYSGLNLDQTGFDRTKGKPAPEEEPGDRLHVPAAEETARTELQSLCGNCLNCDPHPAILNAGEIQVRPSQPESNPEWQLPI